MKEYKVPADLAIIREAFDYNEQVYKKVLNKETKEKELLKKYNNAQHSQKSLNSIERILNRGFNEDNDDLLKILDSIDDIYLENPPYAKEIPQELCEAILAIRIRGYLPFVYDVLSKYQCSYGDKYLEACEKVSIILRDYYRDTAKLNRVLKKSLPEGIILKRKFKDLYQKHDLNKFEDLFFSNSGLICKYWGVPSSYMISPTRRNYNLSLTEMIKCFIATGVTDSLASLIRDMCKLNERLWSSVVKIFKEDKDFKENKNIYQVLPVEKPTFSFSLFGYEFSFKVKKKEPLEFVDLSDEFPDEVEY